MRIWKKLWKSMKNKIRCSKLIRTLLVNIVTLRYFPVRLANRILDYLFYDEKDL